MHFVISVIVSHLLRNSHFMIYIIIKMHFATRLVAHLVPGMVGWCDGAGQLLVPGRRTDLNSRSRALCAFS